MERMTREEYMMKKADIETRMHQTRINERNAIKALTLQFEDRLQDEQIKFRKLRDSIMDERDMKRVEIENEYKQRRRELWAEDCELVDQWRAQLGDMHITPPLLETGSMRKEVKYELC